MDQRAAPADRTVGTGAGSPVQARTQWTRLWCPVGAELVIRGGDLRRRCTVAVGHDVSRGGTTAVSDLPTSDGLAGAADAQRGGR